MNESIELVGEVIRTSKRAYGEWSWALIAPDASEDASADEEIKIVGDLGRLRVGSRVIAHGQWKEHSRWGKQFVVTGVAVDLPKLQDGIETWLMDTLPQIGPVRARECVRRWPGDTLWAIIERDPMALRVLGLSEEQTNLLVHAYEEAKGSRVFYVTGFTFGLSSAEVRRIARYVGKDDGQTARYSTSDIWSEVAENPHILYHHFDFSFARAEEVGRIVRADLRHPSRFAAALCEVLRVESRNGHTVVSSSNIYDGLMAVFNNSQESINTDDVNAGLILAGEKGWIVESTYSEGLALASLDRAEGHIAKKIKDMLHVRAWAQGVALDGHDDSVG